MRHIIHLSIFTRLFCLRITFCALILAFFSPHTAYASLLFCNRTQQPIEAALGHREQGQGDEGDIWVSEGWWQIEPGQCSKVYSQPLDERFYFYYANAMEPAALGQKPAVWQGKYQFCVDNKAFRIEGDGECEPRGFHVKGFQQIDLGPNAKDYTLDFKDMQ